MDGFRRRILFALGAIAASSGGAYSASAQVVSKPACSRSITLGPWSVSRTLGSADNFGIHKLFDTFTSLNQGFLFQITITYEGENIVDGRIKIETKSPMESEALSFIWPPMPIAAEIDGAPIRVVRIRVNTTETGSEANYGLNAELARTVLTQLIQGRTLRLVGSVYDPATPTGSKQVSAQFDLTPLLDHQDRMSVVEADLREQLARGSCQIQTGACFLTTVCCNLIGLPDDCFELRRLRAFRDRWLIHQPGGAEAIAHYYEVAPEIADTIHTSRARDRICRTLYFAYILPALALDAVGLRDAAWRHYARLVIRAEAMGQAFAVSKVSPAG